MNYLLLSVEILLILVNIRERTVERVAVCSSVTAHTVWVTHGSNFGRVVTCNATTILVRIFKKKIMQEHACNGVFVCHCSQTVSHISNFGRVDICNAAISMASNIWKKNDETISTQNFLSRRRSDGGKTAATCSGSFALAWCRHAKEADYNIRTYFLY